MKNIEIAAIFYAMADILELQDVKWKPIAYRKAARAIETLSEPIEEVYKKGGIKALMEIPGVGEAIAKKTEEFILTGKVKEYERLRKKIPKGLREIMDLQGLGPKKAIRLYKELKINSIEELEAAAKEGRIAKLEGFGEKTEENIIKAIEIAKKGKERLPLGVALPIAREIVEELKTTKGVKRIEIGGSLRRRVETIGDIDILAEVAEGKDIMDRFVSLPNVVEVLAKGEKKSMIVIEKGDYRIQVDLRIIESKSFGAALQYFTGNKEHNIELRKIAISKGWKLNEYGIFKGEKQIAGENEEEIYEKLGMKWIPPELRENKGEIKAAIDNKLPNLIDVKDIKGDLHVHTNWSEGTGTIEEMVIAAKKKGYEYIGIADHSKSERIANGMDEKRIEEQIETIKEIRKKIKGIQILHSSEVSILPDGSLDYSDDILKRLDYVVASVHSRFKSPKSEMTNRILNALENKYVKILGHPTGRLINERMPYEVDMDQIMEVCKERSIAMEVNSFPLRLDLNDIYVRKAKEIGIKLCINTDAHAVDHLNYIEYGVGVARRGWCEKNDVLNAMDFKKLIEWFSKR
ncbi:MAG: DNA polymerase/3'-5' exonuclease PolX [Candidatus Micrarchaeia archaeon]